NADGALSPGEVWTSTARRTVVAGDPDPLTNTVTANAVVAAGPAEGSDGRNVITPDADSIVTHSVDLFQPSLHVVKAGDTLGKVEIGRASCRERGKTRAADGSVIEKDSAVGRRLGWLREEGNNVGLHGHGAG